MMRQRLRVLAKRSILAFSPLMVLAMLAACAAAASPTAAVPAVQTLDMTPTRIRFGYPTGIAFPTLIVARDRGYFAKENLTIEESQMGSSGLINDALATGNLDMGETTATTAVLAIVKGAKMIMVSGFEYTFIDKSGKSWESIYVVVRSGEGIQKVTDLKGKKIALNSLGGSTNYTLRAYMLANHIDPDKDITIVPVPVEQIPGALMQKLVDAAVVSADGYAQLEKQAKVDAIGSQTGLMNLDMDLSAAVGVNDDFLTKHPDAVVRFLRAFIQAREWMAEDVSQKEGKTLTELVASAMKYSPERAKSLYDTRGGYYGKELDFVNLLDIPTRVVTRNYEILKLNGFIKPDTADDYARVVDIRYLKQAYETLGLKWDESKH
jgi:ABC-type nitrate/sulfonate/bicarbonate transport system substrate-binding protein